MGSAPLFYELIELIQIIVIKMVIIADSLHRARLIERVNRFVGIIELEEEPIWEHSNRDNFEKNNRRQKDSLRKNEKGVEEKYWEYLKDNPQRRRVCHILNPGRMIRFLKPHTQLLVEYNNNPHRKTRYSLKYVIHGDIMILIDSIAPNLIFKEALHARRVPPFNIYENLIIRDEVIYGGDKHSRIDFLLEAHGAKMPKNIYIEIKSTNYASEGIGYFPDAPSTRAQKHLRELIALLDENEKRKTHKPRETSIPPQTIENEVWVIFLAQRPDIREVRPFEAIDPEFTRLFREGVRRGLKTKAFSIEFKKGGLEAELGDEIAVNPFGDGFPD